MMLLTQALTRLVHLWKTGVLPDLPEDLLRSQLPQLLAEVSIFTLRSRNSNGSWGSRDSNEETAYAILVLANGIELDSMKEDEQEMRLAIEEGRKFLLSAKDVQSEHVWVEKVTYASDLLSESYVLAALNINFSPKVCITHFSDTIFTS